MSTEFLSDNTKSYSVDKAEDAPCVANDVKRTEITWRWNITTRLERFGVYAVLTAIIVLSVVILILNFFVGSLITCLKGLVGLFQSRKDVRKGNVSEKD